MSNAARTRTTDERLDSIESLLAQVLRESRARKRKGAKRGGTVAQRAAAGVAYRPTELQRAFVRRKMLASR